MLIAYTKHRLMRQRNDVILCLRFKVECCYSFCRKRSKWDQPAVSGASYINPLSTSHGHLQQQILPKQQHVVALAQKIIQVRYYMYLSHSMMIFLVIESIFINCSYFV